MVIRRPDDAAGTPGQPLVVLYTRSVCPLCDIARAGLEAVLREYALDYEVRDVESDPDWERRYGQQIPVVFVGEHKAFKYRLDEARLRRLLDEHRQAGATD